jgi:hypothetical protein
MASRRHDHGHLESSVVASEVRETATERPPIAPSEAALDAGRAELHRAAQGD